MPWLISYSSGGGMSKCGLLLCLPGCWLAGVIGPRMVSVIGDIDLTGDDAEAHLAVRLRALEARISASPAVAGAVLSLSAPDEPTLAV